MSALEQPAAPGAMRPARRGVDRPRAGEDIEDIGEEDEPERQSASVTWSYTLAHAETPLRERALGARDLEALAEVLRARAIPLPAGFASPRARERLTSAPGGPRYIWGFTALDDALRAARAIRRSDYHAYPEPASLREASLDRLYRRFPLNEFPRATVILFSGAPVCPDPLLGPDPAPGSLAAELAGALGPEAWERFTLLGFRQGGSLVRVMPSDRWVRLSPRALEDAWEAARRALAALPIPGDPDDVDASASGGQNPEDAPRAARPAPPDPERQESAAFQALLRILTSAGPSEAAPPPLPAPPARERRARSPRTRHYLKRQELRG